MYKCTECGLEFENKPEYCDCGNDEFVLTVEEKSADETVSEPIKTEEMPVENISKTYEPKFSEYKHESNKFFLPVSPYALIIFILCLIFSYLIVFLWNPVSKTADKVTEIIEKVENKNIPSIDKLWKESVIHPEQKTEPVVKQEIKQIVQSKPKPTVTVKQPIAKPKTTQPAKPQNKVTQPKPQSSVQNSVQQKPVVQQPSISEAQKQAEEAEKKAKEAQQKAEQEALIAAQKAKAAALAKQELYNYKINLRNEIGKKIDFTRVIGDGDCAVVFKVDQNGKLINRSFAKQSSNITLNNAVYNAVMATPVFMQPPKSYNNETLRLNVSFTNGNFAIILE